MAFEMPLKSSPATCEIVGLAASKKKELVVVPGASHYDLYDKPEPVRQALAKLIPFYKENMG